MTYLSARSLTTLLIDDKICYHHNFLNFEAYRSMFSNRNRIGKVTTNVATGAGFTFKKRFDTSSRKLEHGRYNKYVINCIFITGNLYHLIVRVSRPIFSKID